MLQDFGKIWPLMCRNYMVWKCRMKWENDNFLVRADSEFILDSQNFKWISLLLLAWISGRSHAMCNELEAVFKIDVISFFLYPKHAGLPWAKPSAQGEREILSFGYSTYWWMFLNFLLPLSFFRHHLFPFCLSLVFLSCSFNPAFHTCVSLPFSQLV